MSGREDQGVLDGHIEVRLPVLVLEPPRDAQ